MKKSASIDVLQHSQTTEDRFSDELGALVARVYLKLKQDFPELFTIRDLKRATEALTLFLESGLSEKDAFVDTCHYAFTQIQPCLLYTSDAADDLLCVDLGGRRIIKKKKKKKTHTTK